MAARLRLEIEAAEWRLRLARHTKRIRANTLWRESWRRRAARPEIVAAVRAAAEGGRRPHVKELGRALGVDPREVSKAMRALGLPVLRGAQVRWGRRRRAACAVCGREFPVRLVAPGRPTRCCSRQCGYEWLRRAALRRWEGRRPGRSTPCAVCGRVKYHPPSALRWGRGKTCSHSCAGVLRRRRAKDETSQEESP